MVLQSGAIAQGDNNDSDEGENEVFEEQRKGILFFESKTFLKS
jgi:hypothetical protein